MVCIRYILVFEPSGEEQDGELQPCIGLGIDLRTRRDTELMSVTRSRLYQ